MKKPGRLCINAFSLALLVKELQDFPHTVHDLADLTGLHAKTIGRYIRMFHKVGLVHISGWEKNSRGIDCTAVYTWGTGTDKKKHAYTEAEKQRRFRARRKLNWLARVSAAVGEINETEV